MRQGYMALRTPCSEPSPGRPPDQLEQAKPRTPPRKKIQHLRMQTHSLETLKSPTPSKKLHPPTWQQNRRHAGHKQKSAATPRPCKPKTTLTEYSLGHPHNTWQPTVGVSCRNHSKSFFRSFPPSGAPCAGGSGGSPLNPTPSAHSPVKLRNQQASRSKTVGGCKPTIKVGCLNATGLKSNTDYT